MTLYPGNGQCFVSGELVTEPTTLVQGSLVQFGRMVVLRFNHPREAYKMKEERRVRKYAHIHMIYVCIYVIESQVHLRMYRIV